MPVLDYLRYLKNDDDGSHMILVPPFHTGHLGFVPGSDLSVYESPAFPPSGSFELSFLPFHKPIGTMFQMDCLLYDQPGALNRAIEAVASLGLNIVRADSCTVNNGRHHYVEFILDWDAPEQPRRANFLKEFTRVSHTDDRRYEAFTGRWPVHDERYLLLLDRLLSRCDDLLVFDRSYADVQPSVHVRAMSHRSWRNPTSVIVGRPSEPSYAYDVQLSLPADLVGRIRDSTGFVNADELVPFVLSSDPHTNTLRALFPSRDSAERLIHVAFDQLDQPGALVAVSRVLQDAGFNAITSLLRKTSRMRATWEVVLEQPHLQDVSEPAIPTYGIRCEPPTRDERETLYEASLRSLHDLLVANSDQGALDACASYDTSIVPPRYPRHPGLEGKAIALPLHYDPAHRKAQPARQLVEEVPERYEPPNVVDARRTYRSIVTDSRHHDRPRLFLSYPRSAFDMVQQLLDNETLRREFELEDFQRAVEPREILNAAMSAIARSDCFVGIWHHEEWEQIPTGHPCPVSPWMPFEYGVAKAYGCLADVWASDRLHDDVLQRLEKGKLTVTYKEATFATQTIPLIVQHCVNDYLPHVQRRRAHVSDPLNPRLASGAIG
jgi:ACT domain-containing protein